MISSNDIREQFLQYFERQGHTPVRSSSLIPANDPTLLFTNAGMVQFKDVFLGNDKRSYTRAVSSQRCVRAGGKHNDLENVGYTARHHTFFEMLGNFSFGDYFKRDAIRYAWEFLTQVLKLPPERLWVTVFEEDNEAADIWLKEIKVDPKKFSRIGAKDNFWAMGDTGPCGPCSEIFYDHGATIPGGPPGTKEADGDRYIEIWNLVFMQYDRQTDGTLVPLPKPSVDTGMGLERLAAVLQGVHSNYEIDLFSDLIKAAAQATGCKQKHHSSLNVLVDHIRSCAFLIVDGVIPSNEGRGYVLRRIIRRAARHGYKLGQTQAFFYQLLEPLCKQMGTAFPELVEKKAHTEQVLRMEEERFAETLEKGMKILDAYLPTCARKIIAGDFAFKLYDTYGFPLDLTADIARERGFDVDHAGFDAAMTGQQEAARKAGHFGLDYSHRIHSDARCDFTGYTQLEEKSKILGIYVDGKEVKSLKAGETAVIVLEKTPFYAESGGQVGDRGVLITKSARFVVNDTQKQGSNLILHVGKLETGSLKTSELINAQVDATGRQATALNHSATHLLHAALRTVLGEHVTQKGSLVNAERLRFDFSHSQALSAEQFHKIETKVNEQIRSNAEVVTQVMQYDAAVKAGAMALFGEKYTDQVRVLSIGGFSTELCGGTHAKRAGDIGLFKIIAETGIAAGVRRVEAVTGAAAINYIMAAEQLLGQVSDLLKTSNAALPDKVQQVLERTKALEKELAQLKGKLASSQGSDLVDAAVDIKGVKVLAACMDGVDPKSLRDTVDQLKHKLGSAVIILATVTDGKVSLVAGVTKDQTNKIKAGDLVNLVALRVGGKGGGRPDMAQAGGTNPEGLSEALKAVPAWVKQQLQ